MRRLKSNFLYFVSRLNKLQKVILYICICLVISFVFIFFLFVLNKFIFNGSFNSADVNNDKQNGNLNVVFVNDEYINWKSIEPGYSETKTFLIKNTKDSVEHYSVYFRELLNEFVNKEDLVYSLEGSNGVYIDELQIPSSGKRLNILSNIKIEGNKEHKYVIKMEYRKKDYNQSIDRNKKLKGSIEVLNDNRY